jgi:hypothetical protein
MHQYIEDCLNRASMVLEVVQTIHSLLQLIPEFGWIVNLPKSIFSQSGCFLKKPCFRNPHSTPRGLMEATDRLVPLGPLHMWPDLASALGLVVFAQFSYKIASKDIGRYPLVDKQRQFNGGFRLTSQSTCLCGVHKCLDGGVGCSLYIQYCLWLWSEQKQNLHIYGNYVLYFGAYWFRRASLWLALAYTF